MMIMFNVEAMKWGLLAPQNTGGAKTGSHRATEGQDLGLY